MQQLDENIFQGKAIVKAMYKRIHLSETESTNSYFKELLSAGIDFEGLTLADADFQTGGRGQAGNSWESNKGENLTFSLLCSPIFIPASSQFYLSQVIALAVWTTLNDIVEGVSIKWPNDIYWHDKKICGILIESDLRGSTIAHSILGVGLNINQTTFLSDAPNPVSLAQIVGFSLDRDKILNNLIGNFEKYYEILRQGHLEEIRTNYLSHLYRKEGIYPFATADGKTFMAEIVDVEPSGMLVLRHTDGSLCKYEFKQVKWILNT